MSSHAPLTRRAALGLIAGLLPTALGCSRRTATERPPTPQRVVSLTPNTTEAIFAIGAGARLVARSRYCDYPPEVRALPAVGGYVDPSFEAILAARPDLVIGARGPSGRSLVDRLEERGIRTWFPVTETIVQIEQMISGLAELLGVANDGERVVRTVRARLQAIDAKLAGKSQPRALLVFGLAPIVVAGPGGFPDEMLSRAGMINVVRDAAKYPTINVEAVITLDPDLVIDASMAEGGGVRRINENVPGWSAVRAVREGRVVAVRDDAVLRPGPRVADGVAALARIAHPEISEL